MLDEHLDLLYNRLAGRYIVEIQSMRDKTKQDILSAGERLKRLKPQEKSSSDMLAKSKSIGGRDVYRPYAFGQDKTEQVCFISVYKPKMTGDGYGKSYPCPFFICL